MPIKIVFEHSKKSSPKTFIGSIAHPFTKKRVNERSVAEIFVRLPDGVIAQNRDIAVNVFSKTRNTFSGKDDQCSSCHAIKSQTGSPTTELMLVTQMEYSWIFEFPSFFPTRKCHKLKFPAPIEIVRRQEQFSAFN